MTTGQERGDTIPAIVVANVVPLLGVVFLDWDLFETMVSFWLENGVVGLYNALRIPLAGRPNEGSRWSLWVQKSGAIPFFALHYSLFWLGHGILITRLFAPRGLRSWHDIARAGEIRASLAAALASQLLRHGVACFRGRDRLRAVSPFEQMMKPYGRVLVLHATVIAGGFAVELLGSPLPALVTLVVAKTVLDLVLWGAQQLEA
jgi:hypothetical protein